MAPQFHVSRVEWHDREADLSALRKAVFCAEQGVPESLEIDGIDPDCLHVAAIAGGRLVGTGRLLPSGRIGRMAVAADWRGRGVGRALLTALVAEARRLGHQSVCLSAQTGAIGFYEKMGFRAVSGVYMEAGIPHRDMRLQWSPAGVGEETSL